MSIAISTVVIIFALVWTFRRKEWGLGVVCVLAGLLISTTAIGQGTVRTVNGVVNSISNAVK